MIRESKKIQFPRDHFQRSNEKNENTSFLNRYGNTSPRNRSGKSSFPKLQKDSISSDSAKLTASLTPILKKSIRNSVFVDKPKHSYRSSFDYGTERHEREDSVSRLK